MTNVAVNRIPVRRGNDNLIRQAAVASLRSGERFSVAICTRCSQSDWRMEASTL